jgi:7-carboxy-7-deazaguanine synthase
VVADKRFRVAEIFGPTIQGEADMLGTATHFIRFGGCDYRCVWCDSPQAVFSEEVAKLERLTEQEITARVCELPGRPEWVTFSGGNPALFDLDDLVAHLHLAGFAIAIETQGTIFKPWMAYLQQVTISPKPPSSGNSTAIRRVEHFLSELDRSVRIDRPSRCLKVVCMNDPEIPHSFEDDWDYAVELHKAFPEERFWIQVGNHDRNLPTVGNGGVGDPDAPVDIDTMLRDLTRLGERVAADPSMGDVRVTPQLHVLMWGNERGK